MTQSLWVSVCRECYAHSRCTVRYRISRVRRLSVLINRRIATRVRDVAELKIIAIISCFAKQERDLVSEYIHCRLS